MAADAPAILDHLLSIATDAGGSDLHLEPRALGGVARLRRDGGLVDLLELDGASYPALVARIKGLAGLDITEHQRPQDGRFVRTVGARGVELRVSILPAVQRESVVLRILDRSVTGLDLARLGVGELERAALGALAERASGLVLISGPTGSGKTTTLYAMLSLVDRARLKVIAIEDPVEYALDGVVQIEVASAFGITFATALRSTLRQDPDVILVGEVRDGDTASAAVEASLTGHLVLATIHATDGVTATRRLLDLGAPRSLLVESLAAIASQRLVRRVCAACRAELEPTAHARALALLNAGPHSLPLYAAVGCSACSGLGYRGRFAVIELVATRPTDVETMLDSLELSRNRLVGERTLRDRAVAAALAGWTTPDEVVARVLA